MGVNYHKKAKLDERTREMRQKWTEITALRAQVHALQRENRELRRKLGVRERKRGDA